MAKRPTGKQGKEKATVGHRYRLAPSPETAERLRQWGHTRRALWNLLLSDRRLAMSLRKRPDEFSDVIAELRSHFDWVEDFPAQAAAEVSRNLETAYSNWANPDLAAEAPPSNARSTRLRFSLPGQAV